MLRFYGIEAGEIIIRKCLTTQNPPLLSSALKTANANGRRSLKVGIRSRIMYKYGLYSSNNSSSSSKLFLPQKYLIKPDNVFETYLSWSDK